MSRNSFAFISGETPFFIVSAMRRNFGCNCAVSSGGYSIKAARQREAAWNTSSGVKPKVISRGTTNGSLKRTGELHLSVRLVRTRLAVVADMYLKKLCRSWVLYLERI